MIFARQDTAVETANHCSLTTQCVSQRAVEASRSPRPLNRLQRRMASMQRFLQRPGLSRPVLERQQGASGYI
eukprot:s744_g2.t1